MAVIKVLLHEFKMGDVEDPEIYAAQPLWEWQNTEFGQWCMANCKTPPVFHINRDVHNYGFLITVTGELEEKDYVFWKLKYSQ